MFHLENLIHKCHPTLIYHEIGAILRIAKQMSAGKDNSEGFMMSRRFLVDLILDIPNIRSIRGQNLQIFFGIFHDLKENPIDVQPNSSKTDTSEFIKKSIKVQENRKKVLKDCRKVLLLAASNLQSMEPYCHQTFQGIDNDFIKDINSEISDDFKSSKLKAMDIYLELYNSDPTGFEEDLKSTKYNVSPLSNLIAEEVHNLTHH